MRCAKSLELDTDELSAIDKILSLFPLSHNAKGKPLLLSQFHHSRIPQILNAERDGLGWCVSVIIGQMLGMLP